MPITRADVESVVVRRCGRKLALAGLDGVTCDGTNPDLNDPIADALAALGLPPASIARVTDADLEAVAPGQAPMLCDVTELRALESALGNLDQPDQKADTDNSQDFGRFANGLEITVARRRRQCERQHGYGLAPLTAGTLDLGFAARVDRDGRPCP